MEKSVENYLKKEVQKLDGKCLKWTSPGTRGVMDRICVFPSGKVWFVETKDRGKKPSPLQAALIREFQELGLNVTVIDTKADVDKFILKIKNNQRC